MPPKEVDEPEIHTEELALFSRPPVNVAEDKISWTEIRSSFMSGGEYSSVQFTIPGNSSQYVKLSDSELHVKINIEKEDGMAFDKSTERMEAGLPIDLILHSVWSSVDIKMNHALVSTSGTDYMYKALLETLLNYNENSKKIQLANAGFSGDSGNFAQTHPLVPPLNKGLRTRYIWFDENSVSVEFIGPLMANICNQDRLILPGVDIDIKLWPTRDEFRLMTHLEDIRCKLIVEDISFHVCKVKVSPEVMMGHNAGLEISDSVYPFQRTDIHTFNVSDNLYATNLEDIWQGEVPTRLVVRMVKSQAYNGDMSLNPFHFQHFNVSSIGFFVDGESIKMDVENGQYLQGLISLYRVSGKLMENSDIGISRENYKQGYNLIGFYVDPTTSADLRYLGKPRQCHTKLEIKFKEALPDPVTLILYATLPEVMTIDQSRNVQLEVKDKLNKHV